MLHYIRVAAIILVVCLAAALHFPLFAIFDVDLNIHMEMGTGRCGGGRCGGALQKKVNNMEILRINIIFQWLSPWIILVFVYNLC
jgi:hypothetical protein